MDVRLEQMQHSLFGDVEAEARDIDQDTFCKKVQDLRWDTPASVLDVEMLKANVRRHDKGIRARLTNIENTLTKIYPRQAAQATEAMKSAKEALGDGELDAGVNARRATQWCKDDVDSSKWIEMVPLDLLLHELKCRNQAPP